MELVIIRLVEGETSASRKAFTSEAWASAFSGSAALAGGSDGVSGWDGFAGAWPGAAEKAEKFEGADAGAEGTDEGAGPGLGPTEAACAATVPLWTGAAGIGAVWPFPGSPFAYGAATRGAGFDAATDAASAASDIPPVSEGTAALGVWTGLAAASGAACWTGAG
jgi:hypothetical protein